MRITETFIYDVPDSEEYITIQDVLEVLENEDFDIFKYTNCNLPEDIKYSYSTGININTNNDIINIY